jgi:branched-chain amino acid transport system substrate-binding protein
LNKTNRFAALVLVLVLLFGAALSACSPQAAGENGEGEEEKIIKIGFIGCLTGDTKTYGESAKNGFELALEQADYKAGGYKIQTVVADDRNDPTEAVNVATKLISQDKVSAIMGAVTTAPTIPVSEVANQNKILMITGTATAEKVTVDNGRKEYCFRACFIDRVQAVVGAKFALETLEAKTAAVIYDQGSDYTKGLAEVFKDSFEAGGGSVVAYEAYAKEDTDFSAQLTSIAAKNPDILYLPDYYQKSSLIGQQARQKGITAVFLGCDGWDSSDLDFDTMEGGYFTNHYSSDDQRQEVKDWVKAYEAKHGSKPDALGTLAYDATNLLLNAIEQTQSNDPVKLQAAMKATKDFKAVTGSLSFDENGNPVKPAVILQVKDGGYEYIETVSP